LVSVEEEILRYNQHNNNLSNTGYVAFLSKLKNVINEITPKYTDVLDFGCGKNAVLSELLRNDGYNVHSYDPLFDMPLEDEDRKYNVIVLCEVIEHIRDLQNDIALIKRLLKSGGKVLIRTRLMPSVTEVPRWWYAQDKTHINFFSEQSIAVLAGYLNLQVCKTIEDDIFVLA
ncbi:MAG: class I SAM-dependent methyltransferase, partial [Fibrobacter sp.]|nr:class I SAM-dependent methyltransferase [Fibrobacter sp.]